MPNPSVSQSDCSPAACLATAIVRYFQVDDEDGMLEALVAHRDVLPHETIWARPDVYEQYANSDHVCCEKVDD